MVGIIRYICEIGRGSGFLTTGLFERGSPEDGRLDIDANEEDCGSLGWSE